MRWLSMAMLLAVAQVASAGAYYSENFDGGSPAAFSGAGSATSVQNFAGVGHVGNTFAGSFMRNTSSGDPPDDTALILSGLPQHAAIDVHFLLAIIDTWDGASSTVGGKTHVGDYFNVRIDGQLVFREAFDTFNPADGYAYPDGALLANVNMGFNNARKDSAHDMSFEPALTAIAHTSSTLTVSWFADGPGWQGGSDESWAIDNLTVRLRSSPEALVGDANNDGVVSADDFAAVQANFGHTGPAGGWLLGDANGDGSVAADDFASIQTRFGQTAGASAGAAPVPEPASMVLLAGAALLKRRRR